MPIDINQALHVIEADSQEDVPHTPETRELVQSILIALSRNNYTIAGQSELATVRDDFQRLCEFYQYAQQQLRLNGPIPRSEFTEEFARKLRENLNIEVSMADVESIMVQCIDQGFHPFPSPPMSRIERAAESYMQVASSPR